jgi:uncharacterized protein (DUF2141 family)
MRGGAGNSDAVPSWTLLARLRRLMLVVSVAAAASAARAADLEVEVRGVRPRAGDIHAALFDRDAFALDTEVRGMISSGGEVNAGVFTGQDEFPRPPVDKLTVTPTARTLRVRFPDLQPGEYAVGAYQDLNGNGRLDATVARNPTEPWAVSNNPRPNDRAPTWDEAKFTLSPEGARIVLELR